MFWISKLAQSKGTITDVFDQKGEGETVRGQNSSEVMEIHVVTTCQQGVRSAGLNIVVLVLRES